MIEALAILFVDRTNTWASPLANAAFQHHAQRLGLTARSASVGLLREYAGDPASADVIAFAAQQGLDLRDHHVRQLRLQDLRKFTHVVALDHESFAMVRAMRSDGLSLIDEYAEGSPGDLACDPISGEPYNAHAAWDVISSAARGLAVKFAAASHFPPARTRERAVAWV